jgi:hypothetical protein
MRVRNKLLLAVLDPEGKNPRRAAPGSARSTGSGRRENLQGAASPTPGGASSTASLRSQQGSRQGSEAFSKHELDLLEFSAFDLLHTEQGFVAFEQWYRRTFAGGTSGAAAEKPHVELGFLWPQAFCPPSALHEYAFMELLRAFAECSDSEALDFFDLLDCDFLGMLSLPQVYLAICLVSALGSRQLLKFLYFHSTNLFRVLQKGCPGVVPERLSWPRLLVLLRLLGTPGYLASRIGAEAGISSSAIGEGLSYEEFMVVMFPIMQQLDRGAEVGESTVINESDRMVHVKSKMCTIL